MVPLKIMKELMLLKNFYFIVFFFEIAPQKMSLQTYDMIIILSLSVSPPHQPHTRSVIFTIKRNFFFFFFFPYLCVFPCILKIHITMNFLLFYDILADVKNKQWVKDSCGSMPWIYGSYYMFEMLKHTSSQQASSATNCNGMDLKEFFLFVHLIFK